MREALTATGEYRAAFERLSADPQPPWLRSLRKAAFERFEKLGFPSVRLEDWKYTNIDEIANTAFRVGNQPVPHVRANAVAPFQFGDLDAALIVLVNGRYSPQLSKPTGLPDRVRFQSLAEALHGRPQDLEAHLGQVAGFDQSPLVALNTAIFADGVVLDVPRGTIVERPVHILHLSVAGAAPAASFPRVLIRMGPNSQARLIETYAGHGTGVAWTNAVTEASLEEGSVLHHVKIERESDDHFHTHTHHVEQARTTALHHHNLVFGARLARTDLVQRFEGEGAELTLNGLYLLRGTQHVDNHTSIDHANPRCTSREFYKGILDDKSRGVFYGKVFVRPGAQKTNANQTNKNLLLSDGALVDSTPALEINADDVKCAHGSTIGQLDADHVFYLQSRGIEPATARSLLTYAFAHELLQQVPIPSVRDAATRWIIERLPDGNAVQEAMTDAE